MKSLAKSIKHSFSAPTVSRYISKITAVASITLAAAFSTNDALADGEALYKAKCIACHGPTGAGIPNVFPPLAESEWVNGPEENLIRIQLRGLQGQIDVKGVTYNGMMPNNAAMSDQEISDVLTYIRSNMGNNAPAVTVESIKAIRAKVAGNVVPLTVKDLIDPTKAAKKKTPKAKAKSKPKPKQRPESKPKPKTKPEPKPKPKPTAKATTPTPKAQTKTAPKTKIKATTPAIAVPAAAPAKDGKAIYQAKCIACHGPTGDGTPPVFPPLAGSEWVNGPAENLIKIQIHGLQGPIEVKGKMYNGMMPTNAAMTDEDIATVLTYIRSNMGNSASPVTTDQVSTIRKAAGESPAPITVKDLVDPTVEVKETITEPTELENFKPAEYNTSGNTILYALGIIALCGIPAFIGFLKN